MPFIDYRERLKSGPFDLIIADPPWSYDQGQTAVHSMKHVVSYPTISDPTEMLQAFYDSLYMNRNCWIWTDWYTLPKLLDAAKLAGFKYRSLCAMTRQCPTPGYLTGKQMYYLPVWSKGKAYRNRGQFISEWLDQYKVKRSQKPQAVYDKIIAHSLPPDGKWIDPFPATHLEEYPGPKGTTIIKPHLFGDEIGA